MPAEFHVQRTADRESVAATLRTIVDGVLAGVVTLDDGTDAVSVDVPADLDYELELETEVDADAGDTADGEGGGTAVELEVELTWAAGPASEAVPASADDPHVEPTIDTSETAPNAAAETAPEASKTTATDTPDTADDGPVDPPARGASAARFELFTDRADEWRWRLVHGNGNVVAVGGEGYTRKENALNGLASVRSNAPGADVIEVTTEK